jgi:hypothetical protein
MRESRNESKCDVRYDTSFDTRFYPAIFPSLEKGNEGRGQSYNLPTIQAASGDRWLPGKVVCCALTEFIVMRHPATDENGMKTTQSIGNSQATTLFYAIQLIKTPVGRISATDKEEAALDLIRNVDCSYAIYSMRGNR